MTVTNTVLQRGAAVSRLQKPFKRLDASASALTWLKPGVNENLQVEEHGSLQVTTFFQPRDRFAHHAMAEMTLSNAQ